MSNLEAKLGHIISGLVAVSISILTGITIDGGSVGLESNELSSISDSLISGGGSLLNLFIQLLPFIICFTVILIIYLIIKNRFGKLKTGGFSENKFKYHNIQNISNFKSDAWKLHQMNLMVKDEPKLYLINPDLGFGVNYRLRKENGDSYVVYDTAPLGGATEYMADYITGSKFIDRRYRDMKRYYTAIKKGEKFEYLDRL